MQDEVPEPFRVKFFPTPNFQSLRVEGGLVLANGSGDAQISFFNTVPPIPAKIHYKVDANGTINYNDRADMSCDYDEGKEICMAAILKLEDLKTLRDEITVFLEEYAAESGAE